MTETAAAEPADGLPLPRRYIAAAVVLAAIVLAVLDGAIANIALPTIASTLQVSAAASVWVVTGYQMALVVCLLPCAALGESIGFRRVFASGIALFTVASLGCALSPTLPVLVGARIAQGLGAAAIMSMLAALLRNIYPYRHLGSALGLNALFVGLASAAGPTLGAAILALASWPWLFAVNLPIGLIVLIGLGALPRTEGHGRPLDVLSVLLNAGFFAPLVAGADLLTSRPAPGVALMVVAALCLTLLIKRELPRRAPLIPLDLLRGYTFLVSVCASACIFAAQMLAFIALPFYLQHGLGLDPVRTGLYLTPWPLTVALAAPLAGKLSDRVSSALLCVIGGVGLSVGMGLAALWPLRTGLAPLVGFTIVSGLGFGFFQTPNNRNMLLSAPRERSGAAGGMQATARQMGQTAGSVMISVLLAVSPDAAPRLALGASALLGLAAGLISCLRIDRAAPGATGPE